MDSHILYVYLMLQNNNNNNNNSLTMHWHPVAIRTFVSYIASMIRLAIAILYLTVSYVERVGIMQICK